MVQHVRSYEELAPLIVNLKTYLTESAIVLRGDSSLGRMFATFDVLSEAWSSGQAPRPTERVQMVDYCNLCTLAAMVHRIRGTRYEADFRHQLTDLQKGDPSTLSAGERSPFRDRLFEVLCGATCAAFATNVRHEEPDLICEFESVKLFIACKCIYGNASTAAGSLRRGWRQVKKLGRGYIMAHVTDRFPHDKLMSSIAVSDGFHSPEEFQQRARDLFVETCNPYQRALLRNLNTNPQNDRRKLQAVNYLVHTIGNVRGTMCAIGMCLFQPMAESVIRSGQPDSFSREFQNRWERVL